MELYASFTDVSLLLRIGAMQKYPLLLMLCNVDAVCLIDLGISLIALVGQSVHVGFRKDSFHGREKDYRLSFSVQNQFLSGGML